MATQKITVTLQEEQVKEINALVQAGETPSISGFVQHAVNIALNDVAGWSEMLDKALEETGGPLTKQEIRWAESVLGKGSKSKSKGKAA